MKNLILLSISTLAFSMSTLAASISSVTCESQMKFGFFSGNEIGTFTYNASPLKVSVLVAGKGEVVIDDSKHICTVATATEMPISVNADDASLVDLYFSSTGSSDDQDGGNLTVREGGDGSFFCNKLPGLTRAGIALSNCVVK